MLPSAASPRRADVAHQRGRKARLAEHLDHQPADVRIVFDDENHFSEPLTSLVATERIAARVEDDILLGVKQTRKGDYDDRAW